MVLAVETMAAFCVLRVVHRALAKCTMEQRSRHHAGRRDEELGLHDKWDCEELELVGKVSGQEAADGSEVVVWRWIGVLSLIRARSKKK